MKKIFIFIFIFISCTSMKLKDKSDLKKYDYDNVECNYNKENLQKSIKEEKVSNNIQKEEYSYNKEGLAEGIWSLKEGDITHYEECYISGKLVKAIHKNYGNEKMFGMFGENIRVEYKDGEVDGIIYREKGKLYIEYLHKNKIKKEVFVPFHFPPYISLLDSKMGIGPEDSFEGRDRYLFPELYE